MNSLQLAETISLPARDVHRIDNGKGLAVKCLTGVAWITQANDPRDIVLTAGESFVLDRHGLAVVFALKQATIAVGRARERRVLAPELERAYAA